VFDAPVEAPLCTDELLLPLLVLGPNVKVLPLPLLLSPPPSNTLSQQLSTSVLEILPDIPVTHLMNLLFEPVLVLPVVDVSFLVLLEPVGSEPLFFAANAEVTIPLLDAVTMDTAATIAIIANDVVITFFLYIELAV
jgi:hypothetical protein